LRNVAHIPALLVLAGPFGYVLFQMVH